MQRAKLYNFTVFQFVRMVQLEHLEHCVSS